MQGSLVVLALFAIFSGGVNAKSPTKIVSGKRVDITEASYTVMIRHRSSYNTTTALICGGTIISDRHILTAAHCFWTDETDPFDYHHPRWFDVMVGEDSYHLNVEIYEIEEVYSHPNYIHNARDGINDRADIAVIKLKKKIQPSPTQSIMQLASREPASFSKGLASGWGVTNPNETQTLSRTLQGLTLRVYRFKTCKGYYPEYPFNRDELCVIALPEGAVCFGDSGGPLVVNGKLAGVISSTLSCKGLTLGTVINVAYHKPWIEDAVNGTAEAIVYFGTNAANITHTVQNSRPSERSMKPIVRDELSSRYPALTMTKHDNNGEKSIPTFS